MANMTPSAHNQPIDQIQWLDRELLSPNDYNPNHVAIKELELLKLSILEDGWLSPIIANSEMIKGKYPIIDGYHRWLVSNDLTLRALTGGQVPVILLNKTRAENIKATVRCNRARGEHSPVKMGELVAELDALGLDDRAIAIGMGMENEELIRLLDTRKAPERITSTSFSQVYI
jgi:ParB-like chromosome segregation protein Spo0J